MLLSSSQQLALQKVMGVLAEATDARDMRLALGRALLDLLRADHFASFVWDDQTQQFGQGVWLNMSDDNLQRYAQWFQFRDPITLPLQARRHPTLVAEVMPTHDLHRTEFFNDFLARDGLYQGINLHAFDGELALGDLRIWRGRHRPDFTHHDQTLLGLIEPALIAALRRCQPTRQARTSRAPSLASPWHKLSAREQGVARALCRGATDKEIARELGIASSSVRTYLQRLFQKCGVQRRAALADWVARHAMPDVQRDLQNDLQTDMQGGMLGDLHRDS